MEIKQYQDINYCVVKVSEESFNLLLKNNIGFTSYDVAPLYEWVSSHRYYQILNNTAYTVDNYDKSKYKEIFIDKNGLFTYDEKEKKAKEFEIDNLVEDSKIHFPKVNKIKEERAKKTETVSLEIENFIWDKIEKERLTYGETIKLLNDISNSFATELINLEQKGK